MIACGRWVVTLALTALIAGCDKIPPVFEDVGADPHPPEVALLGIGLKPPGGDPDNPPPVAYVPPSTVIAVNPFDDARNTISLRVEYRDAGGDLAKISFQDLDGPLTGALTLPDFPGTSGIVEGSFDFETMSSPGPHRLELWAEDDKGSRSPKIPFTVTVEVF